MRTDDFLLASPPSLFKCPIPNAPAVFASYVSCPVSEYAEPSYVDLDSNDDLHNFSTTISGRKYPIVGAFQ